MDWGDLIAGIFIGTGVGFAAGVCLPEERKGDWVKEKQKRIEKQWKKYDERKHELEKERDEYLAGRKKKKKAKKNKKD